MTNLALVLTGCPARRISPLRQVEVPDCTGVNAAREAFIRHRMMCCCECGDTTVFVFEPTGERCCEACERRDDRFCLCSSTDAMEHFLLERTELRSLNFVRRISPWRSDMEMKFFLRSDVLNLSETKFGGMDEVAPPPLSA